MMTVLAALWPWLLALVVICAGLWWAHKPLDHAPVYVLRIPGPDATDAQFETWVADALLLANQPAAFDRTLNQIRSLPEVTTR